MSQETPQSFQKGYKFRLYPTSDQKQQLRQMFGAKRFVWNCLAERSEIAYQVYQEQCKLDINVKPDHPRTDGFYFAGLIKDLRVEFPWLKEVSAVSLQQTALQLGAAYKRFFTGRKLTRTPGKPQFKSLRDRQSLTLANTGFTLRNRSFQISKMKTSLKVVWTRELPSQPTSCSISMETTGDYYVSFVCEHTPTKTSGTKTTGIDLGLTHLATLSDGTKIDNPKHYQKAQRKLKRLQQSLARKTKGSANRTKARIRVAKCHQHITNQRKDHLHKLSRTLVNENQVIGIETLKVANMVRNRKLAKHIQSAGWSEFTRQLAYKSAESQHCQLVMVDPYFPSSHLCSSTGLHLGRKLKLSERSWSCPHCGQTHDRDVNAAENIATEAYYQYQFHGWDKTPHSGKVLLGSPYTTAR